MTVRTTTDIKQHLELLHTERTLALDTPLRHDPVYMADLNAEILTTRHAYIGSAVTEIASMRALLSGRQQG